MSPSPPAPINVPTTIIPIPITKRSNTHDSDEEVPVLGLFAAGHAAAGALSGSGT